MNLSLHSTIPSSADVISTPRGNKPGPASSAEIQRARVSYQSYQLESGSSYLQAGTSYIWAISGLWHRSTDTEAHLDSKDLPFLHTSDNLFRADGNVSEGLLDLKQARQTL